MSDTRAKLIEGALTALKAQGISGASARNIAAAAGVNQALVFYHFGSVDDLLAAACLHSSRQRVERYHDRFAQVENLPELLNLGREIHAEEREAGNVAVLAQMLAGSQTDTKLAAPTAAGFTLWVNELEVVLQRVLAGSPITALVSIRGLAQLTASAFVGLELFEGVDSDGASEALETLEKLGELVSVLDGPLARTALRRKIRRLG